MRSTAAGLLSGFILATIGFSIHHFQQPANAERPIDLSESDQSAGDVVAFSSPDMRQITLIDKNRQVMCVYHTDAKTGQITLRSARSFRWDLEMDEYNSAEPSPAQIRSLIGSQ